MKTYPKAMYLGTKKKRQKLTHAKDYDHEQVLRGKGFLPYVELPDDDGASQPQTGATGGGDCAELRQNYEQLQSNYEQLQSFSNGLTERWNDVGALSARLQELSPPPPYDPMSEPVLATPAYPADADFESWTVKQIRDELEKYGITPSHDTRKPELIELLRQMTSGDYAIAE